MVFAGLCCSETETLESGQMIFEIRWVYDEFERVGVAVFCQKRECRDIGLFDCVQPLQCEALVAEGNDA